MDAFANYEKAVADLEKSPNNATKIRITGNAAVKIQLVAEAKYYYERLIALSPSDSNLQIEKGHMLFSVGCFESAISTYQSLISKIPAQSEHLWGYIGNVYYHIGNINKALAAYKNSLELESPGKPNVVTSYAAATCMTRLKDYSSACELYDKCLQIDPTRFDVLMNKGSNYQEMGNPKEAIKCFKKAEEINSTSGVMWNCQGVAHQALEDFVAAKICFQNCIKCEPTATAYSLLCDLEARIDDIDSALETIEQGVNHFQLSVDLWQQRADILALHHRSGQETEECISNAQFLL